jgi:tetratricopeptide (TPR) repeat protein
MTRFFYILLSVLAGALASVASGSVSFAADLTPQLDARHKACLERIAVDQDIAYEEAMIWRDQGGGRRARHCEAMALFALGHESEAANRLDELADSRDGGSKEMRLNFRAEAANFWLAAQEADKAFESATAGLAYDEENADLRIARARANVMQADMDQAEAELSLLLFHHPEHAEALRYRADVRMRQARLVAAKADIDASLLADPTSVETALLRGHINEAIRLADIDASLETDGDVEVKDEALTEPVLQSDPGVQDTE